MGSFSVGEEPFSGFYCLTGNAAPRHSNHSNQDYGQDSTSVGPRPDYATVRLYHTLCVAQGGAGMLPASFVYIRFACRWLSAHAETDLYCWILYKNLFLAVALSESGLQGLNMLFLLFPSKDPALRQGHSCLVGARLL